MDNKCVVCNGEFRESALVNGKCAICGGLETRQLYGKIVPLSVDHCHQTGKLRGLLCSKCNAMIGLAKDDPLVLEKAIKFLREVM